MKYSKKLKGGNFDYNDFTFIIRIFFIVLAVVIIGVFGKENYIAAIIGGGIIFLVLISPFFQLL